MATIKFAQRELLCKIVYYGPGLGGKTTNLKYIFNQVPDKYRGNLTSVDTKGDRTLFFDLLPLDYGKFRGFSVRLLHKLIIFWYAKINSGRIHLYFTTIPVLEAKKGMPLRGREQQAGDWVGLSFQSNNPVAGGARH